MTMSNSMELHGVLCRYLRDLRLRTFPDNDEGEHGLRWTNAEIKRVEQLVAAESSLATLNAELLEALIKARYHVSMSGTGDELAAIEEAIAKARSQS